MVVHKDTYTELIACGVDRSVTFCLQDDLFNHQAHPATKQHGHIP